MHVGPFIAMAGDLPKIISDKVSSLTASKALLSSYIVTHDGIDCGF